MKFNNIKYKFGLKKYDLIGDIKDFPIEVVEKMIEKQIEQGNKIDLKIFQRNNASSADFGGFDWVKTFEGSMFWREVTQERNFNLFFKRYPKK